LTLESFSSFELKLAISTSTHTLLDNICKDSLKSKFSVYSKKLNMSHHFWHQKHQHISFSGLTIKLGVFS